MSSEKIMFTTLYTNVYGDAQKQGLRTGDILLSINGTRITEPGELDAALGRCEVGQQVTATFYRRSKQHSVTLTVEEEVG